MKNPFKKKSDSHKTPEGEPLEHGGSGSGMGLKN